MLSCVPETSQVLSFVLFPFQFTDFLVIICMYTYSHSDTFAVQYQWHIQGGGGDPSVRTPPSVSTSLIIHYSQSTYDSLHDTAQLAPVPSEKTITGAASSRYALEVDRTSE